MRSYTPFLKLKVNEVAAFFALESSVRDKICPFFDLPRHKDATEADFCEMVRKSSKKMRKFFGEERFFYLDCFDIPDSITVAGADKFNFIAAEFAGMKFIPAVGLDRATSHNTAVFDAKKNGLINSEFLVIRLQEDDFASFQVVLHDLAALWSAGANAGFSRLIIVLDCRMCLAADATLLANKIGAFLGAAITNLPIAYAIVTGSSVPARIGDVCPTETDYDLSRTELRVYPPLVSAFGPEILGFGDYTIVSPLYSEPDIPPEAMRNVLAPKIVYSFENFHAIGRGGALKTHPRADAQYNDIAAELTTRTYFRGKGYSFGEDYLLGAAGKSSGVTASSILKPTICAHMTYMVLGHPLFI